MMKNRIAGYSKELEDIIREFRRDLENSKKINKSFREMIREILKDESDMSFMSRTDLSGNMLYRLRNQVDENDPPQRSTLISVCVGYDIDLMTALSLLDSLGLGFNRHNPRDYAYSFLLTRCRGKDVDECNEILKELGISEKYFLGKHARKYK